MALRDQPYLPLYVQDFMTDEKLIECSAESTGVYVRILCMMHKSKEYGKILLKQKDQQNGQQINNFVNKVARFLPYTHEVIERSLVELINEDVLQVCGDSLCQKRMIKDNDISLKSSEAGKKSVESKSFVITKGTTKVSTNSEDESEDVNESNINIAFEIFWDLYDKKIDRSKCEKKWSRLKDIDREAIIKYIPKYKQSVDDKQFIRNPETFINNRSWENEIIEKKKEGGIPLHPDMEWQNKAPERVRMKAWKIWRENGHAFDTERKIWN